MAISIAAVVTSNLGDGAGNATIHLDPVDSQDRVNISQYVNSGTIMLVITDPTTIAAWTPGTAVTISIA